MAGGKSVRTPSPAFSSCSEEIVFGGRRPTAPAPSMKEHGKIDPLKRTKFGDEADNADYISLETDDGPIGKPMLGWSTKQNSKSRSKRRRKARQRVPDPEMPAEYEDMQEERATQKAVLDDYMDNMDADDLATLMGHSTFAFRDIDDYRGNNDVRIYESTSEVEESRESTGDVSMPQPKPADGFATKKGKAKMDDSPEAESEEDSDSSSDGIEAQMIDDEEIARRLQDAELELVQMGEAYDDFDVMDFDRPSLGNGKKKNKTFNAGMFYLSDDELMVQMESAWTKDRMKKKERKEHREKLRAEGLLGGKGKKAKKAAENLVVRKTIVEIQDEIRTFIRSDEDSYAFPPMTPDQRRAVHMYAHRLQLESKSMGAGAKRFTILKKKATFTATITENHLNYVLGRPMRPKGNKRGGPGDFTGPIKSSGRARSGPPTTYGHGEVVGADAPEIGMESKGHAMLRKMGWDKGTSLGVDSRGILEPIEQVMRRDRRGLG